MDNMWYHYCKVEKEYIGIENKCMCNWCNKTQKELEGTA